MDRLQEIWEKARIKGVVGVKVKYSEGGYKSYLTEGGQSPPVDEVVLYSDEEEEVFLLFRYPEMYSPVVKEYFRRRFLKESKYRERYWSDTYEVREELREKFREQLFKEAETKLKVEKEQKEPIKSEPKPIYKSKTAIINAVALILVWLTSQYGLDITEEQMAQFVISLLAIINLVLRLVTKEPVKI